MENETDNEVPEITAANPDGGAERLDADPVTSNLHDQLDSLLDEAEQETQPEPITTNEETNNKPPVEPVSPSAGEMAGQAGDSNGQPAPQDQVLPVQNNDQGTADQRPEIDPEIAQIEQPRNLSEKNQNNWRKLQETASHYKKQAEEAEILRQRLAEAETKPSAAPEDYDELKKFRAIFDIKNDPSFKSKYEEPLENAKQSIYSVMRKNGASDELIDSIEKAGGPEKIDQNWWKTNAIDKLQLTDAEKLKRGLLDISDLKEQQEKEIAHAAENAEQILEERKNKSINWYKQESEGIQKHIEDITKEIPWARYQQAPQNATQDQVAKIQQHNAMVSDLHNKFNTALWPQNAQERASVAAAAVLSHKLADQLRLEQNARGNMVEQLKKLTEENNRLKGAGKIPKTNVTSPSPAKADVNSRIKMNSSDAIDMGLDEAGA
jgi:hypothetical protein